MHGEVNYVSILINIFHALRINHPVKKFKYCDLKNEVIKIVKQGSKEIAFPKIENIGAAKEIDGSRLDDDLALLPGVCLS